jgi:hypothetical protein
MHLFKLWTCVITSKNYLDLKLFIENIYFKLEKIVSIKL